MTKDKIRDKLLELLSDGQPLPQALIDQWNTITGTRIGDGK